MVLGNDQVLRFEAVLGIRCVFSAEVCEAAWEVRRGKVCRFLL